MTDKEQSESILITEIDPKIEFLKAKLAIQKKLRPILAEARNPHFKNKYATADDIIAASLEVVNAESIILTQGISHEERGSFFYTKLIHINGYEETNSIPINLKVDCQAIGSQITYFRRYTLAPFLAISIDKDDDGNAAVPITDSDVKNISDYLQKLGDEKRVIFNTILGIQNLKQLRKTDLIKVRKLFEILKGE